MTAPFPGPDATLAEVQAWREERAQEHHAEVVATARARRAAARGKCSSCGRDGHRRGHAVCPNYDTPWRWEPIGEVRGAKASTP